MRRNIFVGKSVYTFFYGKGKITEIYYSYIEVEFIINGKDKIRRIFKKKHADRLLFSNKAYMNVFYKKLNVSEGIQLQIESILNQKQEPELIALKCFKLLKNLVDFIKEDIHWHLIVALVDYMLLKNYINKQKYYADMIRECFEPFKLSGEETYYWFLAEISIIILDKDTLNKAISYNVERKRKAVDDYYDYITFKFYSYHQKECITNYIRFPKNYTQSQIDSKSNNNFIQNLLRGEHKNQLVN